MEPPNGSPIFFRLNLHQPSLSPISRWPYREVNPDDAALLFYQEFVVVLTVQVCDVQQQRSIPQCLLNPRHPDVEDVHHTRGLVILFVQKYKEIGKYQIYSLVFCSPTEKAPASQRAYPPSDVD